VEIRLNGKVTISSEKSRQGIIRRISQK